MPIIVHAYVSTRHNNINLNHWLARYAALALRSHAYWSYLHIGVAPRGYFSVRWNGRYWTSEALWGVPLWCGEIWSLCPQRSWGVPLQVSMTWIRNELRCNMNIQSMRVMYIRVIMPLGMRTCRSRQIYNTLRTVQEIATVYLVSVICDWSYASTKNTGSRCYSQL